MTTMNFFIDPARAIGDPTKIQPDDADGDDDKTVPGGSTKKIDQKMLEFSVKWSFTKMSDETVARNALVELLTLILQLQSETTTLIDHNGQEFAMDPTMNESKHVAWIKKEFKAPLYKAKVRRQQRNTTYNRMYATHKIQTTVSISTIKSHHLFRECMQKHNAFLNVHNFALADWDIAHLGFLQGYNVMHIDKHQTKLCLIKETQAVNSDTPPFELTRTKVRSPVVNGKSFVTQAYKVQCVRANSRQLTSVLTNPVFAKRLAFIPYSCKNTHEKQFCQAVLMQTKNSADMWVIKIQGFSDKSMETVAPLLEQQEGFHTVTPTSKKEALGEWKILVSKDKIKAYYDWLQLTLDDITSALPDDPTTATENYPPFAVTSSNPHLQYEQDDMTDAESFGTMLTNSMEEAAAGIDDNEFQPIELFPDPIQVPTTIPGNFKNPQATYAEIAAKTGNADFPINVTKQHLQNVRKKKYRYGNALKEQKRRNYVGGYDNGSTNYSGNYSTESETPYDSVGPRPPPAEVNLSSMSETPTTAMETLIDELRRANESQALANATQAAQIANLTATVDSYSAMQAEMAYLREGMKLLLQNQVIAIQQSTSSTALSLPTNDQEGTQSSNKRQNTMSTPTKPRPDSLPNRPDVDVDMQQQDQNE